MNKEMMMQMLGAMTEEQRNGFYKEMEGVLTTEEIEKIKETFFYWRCLNDKEFAYNVQMYLGTKLYNELRAN